MQNDGATPAGPWVSNGAFIVSGNNDAHSGKYILSGTPPAPTFVLQAAALDPGQSIYQPVSVSSDCCFTLSFAANVRAQARLVASVSFPELDQGCPPTVTELASGTIPHIGTSSEQLQSLFQHYTLVVCIPNGVTTACVAFQNVAPQGSQGARAVIDNVVFQPTRGPCPDQCSQNF